MKNEQDTKGFLLEVAGVKGFSFGVEREIIASADRDKSYTATDDLFK